MCKFRRHLKYLFLSKSQFFYQREIDLVKRRMKREGKSEMLEAELQTLELRRHRIFDSFNIDLGITGLLFLGTYLYDC